MRTLACIFIVVCFPALSLASEPAPDSSALSILKAVYAKLRSIDHISYQYERIIDYPDANQRQKISGLTYLDFADSNKAVGFGFYFAGDNHAVAFNGKESIYLNVQKQEVSIERDPFPQSLKHLSFLNHSIYSLRNALPWIISGGADKAMRTDTIVDEKGFIVVSFNLPGLSILTNGTKAVLDPKWGKTMYYRITIDPENYMPVSVEQRNNLNADLVLARYRDIRINDPSFNRELLNPATYSAYQRSAKLYFSKPVDDPVITNIRFRLPRLSNPRDSVSPADYSNKVVLIDFWINNCGPCIKAIPDLNQIEQAYPKNNFKLISVNSIDDEPDIKQFLKMHAPIGYDILFNGKPVTERYGISGFPTMLLLDKSGKVVYQGDMNTDKIRQLIDRYIAL